jgi:hypothetical protein
LVASGWLGFSEPATTARGRGTPKRVKSIMAAIKTLIKLEYFFMRYASSET